MSLKNGWTGGQYSLFRVIFGSYLFIHFCQLTPWAAELFSNQGVIPRASDSPILFLFPNTLALFDAPAFVTVVCAIAAVLSLLFALGWRDRWAAFFLWYLWACLFGRNPLISNPGLPYVGWMLLAHVFLPAAPYGAFSARKRTDPRGDWQMPAGIFAVAWILMAVGYSYSGTTKLISPSWVDGTAMARVLENPLARPGAWGDFFRSMPDGLLKLATWGALSAELLFAPLALWRRARPYLWLMMFVMHFGLMSLIDFTDLSLGMVMLHLFTFDPDWLKPTTTKTAERIFYDGGCGLCHRWIRFVLAEDRAGTAFRFAPLASETFQSAVAADAPAELPDSIVVQTEDGKILTRSTAVLHILHRLGGVWRIIAFTACCIPRPLRDFSYDVVAKYRRRLFTKPTEACPLLPADLRKRFDA